jgi:2-polyprenyl-6-hydroxyphenyl methylase/3-demethylubiquinone-9 3-methyltransferase
MRPRNDPGQYDDLADAWWDPCGPFAALHWLAEARARLVPPASRPGAVLVDLGCGGGLLAPHLVGKGYRHIGVDLSRTALPLAREHGVEAVRGDVLSVPVRDEVADVVCAGEILEHVGDHERAVAEACRVLRPGGLLVLDTIAATPLAEVLAVWVGERVRQVPRGIHDPDLFVDRDELVAAAARHGVPLQLRGLRPSVRATVAWQLGRRSEARMVPVRWTAVLFQGRGVKQWHRAEEAG